MSSNPLLDLVSGISNGNIKIIDLTATLEPGIPTLQLPEEMGWGKSWPFHIEEISRYDDRGPAWYWNNFKCGEHTGTHFDAPIHWVTGKDHSHHATDTVAVETFVAPACVIDASAESAADPDFLMSVDFIKQWEAKHGDIEAGSWVLFHSNWSKKVATDEYLNVDHNGSHPPGWEPEAITYLTEVRDVIGVGVETVGTDSGQAAAQEPMFPCHNLMHGANKCGLAGLQNLDKLPPKGAVIIAPPLKIKDGSGSPARVLALITQD
jgi:kynurenine formamidase